MAAGTETEASVGVPEVHIDLTLGKGRGNSLKVNGLDLTELVGFPIVLEQQREGDLSPTLTLRFPDVIASFSGAGHVRADVATAQALCAMGWTPPTAEGPASLVPTEKGRLWWAIHQARQGQRVAHLSLSPDATHAAALELTRELYPDEPKSVRPRPRRILFASGGSIRCTTPGGLCGLDLDHVLLDEALADDAAAHRCAALAVAAPALATGARVVSRSDSEPVVKS